MKPAARVVVDGLSDGGGETDDVVVERLLSSLLSRDEVRGGRRTIYRNRL